MPGVPTAKAEAIQQPVTWCLLENHVFQRLNVIDNCPVSPAFIDGFTSLSNPDILNSVLETEVHKAPPSLGAYQSIILEKLKLENFDNCTLTMWRGPVRHQLKNGTRNSHHHEVWRLCLIRNNATGQGHLWPVGRDTDFIGNLDFDMVRSTSPGQHVVWLDISDLGLETLSEEIGKMPHLRKLECHSNLITEIPGHLCGPEGGPASPLEYIAFNECMIKTVTPRLKELTNLKWLSLNGNCLTEIPDLPPNVDRLSLHCNAIEKLPEALGCEGAVLAMSLHGNKIAEIPPRFFSGLKVINTFSLMRNQLKQLPDTVGDMPQLMDFWVYNNQLTSLPDAIGRCSKLKRFWVDRNALSALPEALGKCTALEQLYASDNALSAVPKSLSKCTRLLRISLDGNLEGCIESLPEMHKDKIVPGTTKVAPKAAPKEAEMPLPREPGAYPSLLKPEEVGTDADWIAKTAMPVVVDRFSIIQEVRPEVKKEALAAVSEASEDERAQVSGGLCGLFGGLLGK